MCLAPANSLSENISVLVVAIPELEFGYEGETTSDSRL